MLRSRTAAYPLITCDPFFSVWSMADELTTPTRHWTGRRAGLYGYILKGGKKYVFMGECPEGCEKLAQKSVEFSAHFTEYSFAGDGLELKAGFFTPYFFDDLASVTVPVSYIYTSFKSDAPAELHIELDGALIGAEDPAAASCSGEAVLSPQTQKILCESGDDCTAKWGYLHILHKNAYAAGGRIGAFTGGENDHFTLGYDSVKAISFMGEKLDGYYKIKYADFNDMISAYDKEFCQNFKKAEALYDRIYKTTC